MFKDASLRSVTSNKSLNTEGPPSCLSTTEKRESRVSWGNEAIIHKRRLIYKINESWEEGRKKKLS